MASVYKTRLRDSEQSKTTLALQNQDMLQQTEFASYTRLKKWSRSTWIKRRRIETSMPEMTGQRVDLQSVEKAMTETKAKTEKQVDCNQLFGRSTVLHRRLQQFQT